MARPTQGRQVLASLPGIQCPQGGLTGTGDNMLLAAWATPSGAGGAVVIPWQLSGFEPDDRAWISLAQIIGPGTAAARCRRARER